MATKTVCDWCDSEENVRYKIKYVSKSESSERSSEVDLCSECYDEFFNAMEEKRAKRLLCKNIQEVSVP